MNPEMIQRYSNIQRYGFSIDNIRIWKIKRFIYKYLKPSSIILDIGCGDGILTQGLVNKHKVIGLDYSESILRNAINKGILPKIGNLEKGISLMDNFCDIIVAGEVIEHLQDTDLFLREIRRILKPDGVCILSTPNLASLPRRLKLLFGINPSMEASPTFGNPAGHLRYFTYSLLYRLLKFHKLKVIEFQSNLIPKRFGSTLICVIKKEI